MDSEVTLRMENWRGWDWDETQNGAHVMRRKGCTMQNQGITLVITVFFRVFLKHFNVLKTVLLLFFCFNVFIFSMPSKEIIIVIQLHIPVFTSLGIKLYFGPFLEHKNILMPMNINSFVFSF